MKRPVFVAACAAVLSGCVMFGSGNEEGLVRRISEEHKVLSVEDWYGGRRIEFDFNGHNAWLVCPAKGHHPHGIDVDEQANLAAFFEAKAP